MHRLKYISLVAMLLLPLSASALAVQWDRPAVGRINPLYILDTVFGNIFTATSSTLHSTFPYASTTALSATTLCLSTDCRTVWPAGTVTSVGATYPVQSSGGTTPVISLAFGTTTSNTWAGTQTFTNAPVFTSLTSGTLNVDSSGVVYKTGTSTPTVTAPITYSGTLGQFIGGVSGTFACTTASAGVTGCLSGTDYNTFNGKQNAIALGAGTINSSAGNTLYATATSTPVVGSGLAYTGTIGQFISGVSGTLSVSGLAPSNFANVAANTVFGNPTGVSATPSFFATSTLFTGTAGQNAYFSGTGTLVGTSSIFIATNSQIGVGSTTPFARLSVDTSNLGTNVPEFVIGSSTRTDLMVNQAGQFAFGTSTFAVGTEPYQFTLTNTDGSAVGLGVRNLSSTGLSGMEYYDQNATLSMLQGFGNTSHEMRYNNISTTPSFNFLLSSVSKLEIASNGFVGIGTTTPDTNLTVFRGNFGTALKVVGIAGGTTDDLRVDLNLANVVSATYARLGVQAVAGGAGNETGDFYISTVNAGTLAEKFRIKANGAIVITAPAGASAGDIPLCLSTGNVIHTAATTCGVSTRKVKNNILSTSGNLAQVLRLNPVTFTYKPGFYNGRTDEGFIAEELNAVNPLFTFPAETYQILPDGQVIHKGDPLAPNTTAILSATVGSVQELNAKIGIQQKLIDDLSARVAALEKKK